MGQYKRKKQGNVKTIILIFNAWLWRKGALVSLAHFEEEELYLIGLALRVNHGWETGEQVWAKETLVLGLPLRLSSVLGFTVKHHTSCIIFWASVQSHSHTPRSVLVFWLNLFLLPSSGRKFFILPRVLCVVFHFWNISSISHFWDEYLYIIIYKWYITNVFSILLILSS